MRLRNQSNVNQFINRHQDRIREKGQMLIQNHTDTFKFIAKRQGYWCKLSTYRLVC